MAFRKGQSGNPAGRPQGSRNRASLAADRLLDGESETITRKAIDLAKAGDASALRLCMDRICPPRKDRFIEFTLPPISKPADAAQALNAIAVAIAAAELTPSEADHLAGVVQKIASVYETAELEARIAALENARAA